MKLSKEPVEPAEDATFWPVIITCERWSSHSVQRIYPGDGKDVICNIQDAIASATPNVLDHDEGEKLELS